jgi:hypothetical protein
MTEIKPSILGTVTGGGATPGSEFDFGGWAGPKGLMGEYHDAKPRLAKATETVKPPARA